MQLQKFLRGMDFEREELRVVHQIFPVLRNKGIGPYPFRIPGQESVSSLEALINVAFDELKRNRPALIDIHVQGIQKGIDSVQLTRQKILGDFFHRWAADAQDVPLRPIGELVEEFLAGGVPSAAEGEKILVSVQDEMQDIGPKVPRAFF